MSHSKPRILLAAATLLIAALPALAQAQNVNACQAQAANLIDEWFHPPGGGDKDFFTSTSNTPPNILFLLDNSGSMQSLVRNISGSGCSDPFYRALPYSPTATYPDFHPTGHPIDRNAYGGFSGLYVKGRVYRPDNSETALATTISGFCTGNGYDATEAASCSSCLSSWGFFRDSSSRQYFDGNLLNIFPPKYVMARRAMTEAINASRNIRMGLAVFDWTSTDSNATWLGSNTKDFNPPCNLAYPYGQSSFDNNRVSIIGALNGMDRGDFNTGTPLANALFRMGQYYNYQDDAYAAWGFPLKNEFRSAANYNQRSMCWGCQLNAVVVVTDGEPYGDNGEIPDAIKNLDGNTHPRLDCPECGTGNLLHKVAYWLNYNDMNHVWEGKQSVFTYTVGFAIDFPLLERAAELGGGKYFPATNADELRNALENIVEDMLNRSATFSTTTVAGVQAQAVQSVLVPKFVPNKEAPWQGELFRFDFLSEFVIEMDLDGDGSESALFLVDSDCTVPATGADLDWGAIRAGEASSPPDCVPVREATEADISANPALLHGRFYKTLGFDDDTLSTTLARPFWEANQKLVDGNPLDRKVFSFIDTNDDGELERVRFHPDNVADFLPYLGMNAGTFCLEMMGRLLTPLDEAACGRIMMRYVLGCRLPEEASELTSNPCIPRQHILGDIFHSPPTIIEPPTPFTLMETPFRHDQSPWTLAYDDHFVSDAGGENAYSVFADAHAERARVALVGSNGGMLHAFHSGNFLSQEGYQVNYDRGTGDELWAVIPPTLLPRLRKLLPVIGEPFAHRYFVDGHPWVRNVWVDGLGKTADIDHKRQPGEFRTVALMSMRQGGNRWFALDVTNVGVSGYEPELLWMFPEVGDPLELFMGQSWSDVQPKPPPIGPVRYKSGSSPAPEYHGEKWRERWVVTIPGGHDPRNLRGRGWYMLDVFTGEMLWEFYHPDKDESGLDSADPRYSLAYSFAAPPTLVAWGDGVSHTWGNAYFDTMIVGDTGGQLWVGRFGNPDPDDWYGARLFEPTIDSSTASSDKVHWHPPFYHSTHLTLIPENGYLRAYLGSGDRANLRDGGGGVCSPDNLGACARSGTCDLEEIHLHNLDLGPASSHYRYETDDEGKRVMQYKDARRNLSPLSTSICPRIEVGSFKIRIDDCVDYEGKDIDDFEMSGSIDCSFNTTTGVYVCTDGGEAQQHRWRWSVQGGSIDALSCTDTTGGQPDRFYSVRVFGGHSDLVPFNSQTEAIDFDKARLTTGTGADNVLRINPDLGTPPAVSSAGAGWYYQYNEASERTATSSVTAGACVIWSSLQAADGNIGCPGISGGSSGPHPLCPPPGAVSCPCDEGGSSNQSFMYFRNYITGAPDCIAYPPGGWDADKGRISMGAEPQPPPAPQVMSQVSGSGQVRTSVVTTDDSVDIGDSEDLLQDFSIIDVPSDVHMWRHAACDAALGANCQ